MKPPSASQISAAREQAGLSQQQAAALVHVDIRSWRRWELAERAVNLAAWELFLLRAGQHPADALQAR
jgi:putative transcriptional regulator